jgi:hypothetical protein
MTSDFETLTSVEGERIRRMAQCWQQSSLSELEMRVLSRRVAARFDEAERRRPVPWWGAIVGLATVSALSVVLGSGSAESGSGRFQALSRDFRETETAVAHVPETSQAIAPMPSRAAANEKPSTPASAAAPAATSRARDMTARKARRVSTTAVRPRVRAALANRSTDPDISARAPTQRVGLLVVEMRFDEEFEGDFVPSPLARDAAALSRAYLWVSDGRTRDAWELLAQLADRGATVGIRRRASELLLRASEPASSSRPALRDDTRTS